MIFEYPNGTVDTNSDDFKQAAKYICDVTGATGWDVIPVSHAYQPGIPDTNVSPGARVGTRGEVFFSGLPSSRAPGFDKFQQDALDVLQRPYVAALCIIVDANLPIKLDTVPRYVDPDTLVIPDKQDWEQPNSPIGPPLASAPGHFTFKHTGQALGAKFTGASGTVYELVQVGGFAFFKAPAWKAL